MADPATTSEPDGIHRLLSNLELTRLQRLFLNSRFTVEGQLQGAHASPLRGFSVEFADYRQYVTGDDLRHLDWRVYGRSERLYIRQYEEECNLRLHLLLDSSRSMAYGYEQPPKFVAARKLAASLAYVTISQQDSVGLTISQAGRSEQYPAKGGRQHLRTLANAMADCEPQGETDLAAQVHQMAEQIQRRALVVIISDCFDDLEKLRTAIAHFRRRKHDVVLYHVLDRAEIDFPFRDLGNFEDLETGATRITNPRAVRRAYQEAVATFLEQLQAICSSLDVDYTLLTTDKPVPPVIQQHLQRRQRQIG